MRCPRCSDEYTLPVNGWVGARNDARVCKMCGHRFSAKTVVAARKAAQLAEHQAERRRHSARHSGVIAPPVYARGYRWGAFEDSDA